MNTPYTQGYASFAKGYLLHEVPYPAYTEEYRAWVEGWMDRIDEEIERVN